MTTQQNLSALAVLTKTDRPALQFIKLDGIEAWATNGYIMAVVPCETKTKALIDPEPITRMGTLDTLNLDELTVTNSRYKKTRPSEVNQIETSNEVDYPPVEQVRRTQGQNRHLRVGLGLSVLEDIVRMMKKTDQETLVLEFSDDPRRQIYGKTGDIELTIMPVVIL